MIRGSTTVICLATVCMTAGLHACLKSSDEIEVIDSSLGAVTPTPTATPRPSATPGLSLVDVLLTDLSGYLNLSAAETAAIKTAGLVGIANPRTTGAAASETLEKALGNAIAWLKANGKLGGDLASRTDIAYKILVAGYVAADELAKAAKTAVSDDHLRAVARTLGSAFVDSFVLASDVPASLVTNYALFCANAISAAMAALRADETLTDAELLTHSSLMVGEMAGNLKEQATYGSADTFTRAYCLEAGGIVIAQLAGATAETRATYKSQYAPAIVTALNAVTGYAEDGARLATCTTEIDAGIAGTAAAGP